MKTYDIAEIASMLANRAENVCRWLLPNGVREGHEWCCGDLSGTPGRSLKVNLAGKAGVWRDFADSEKGGDLIDLIQAVCGVNKADAVATAKEWLGIKDFSPSFTTVKKNYSRPKPWRGEKQVDDRMLGFFASRGISGRTVKQFSVTMFDDSQRGPVIVFPSYRNGELVRQKFRPVADKGGMWTSKDSEPCLFGWQAVPENARAVVIVEGEFDAMAMFEAGFFALSVPMGGGSGEKQDGWIDAEWERMQLFDRIYLALDADEEGISAAKHIARRLGQHRCFFVSLDGHKDANDALLAGADIRAMVERATTVDPEELRSANSYLPEVFNFFEAGGERLSGKNLPWDKTAETVRVRPGEISVWAGTNGHGKSQVVGHLAVDSIAKGERWCIASMEFKPYRLLARLCRQAAGTNQPKAMSDGPRIEKLLADRLWIFDVQGTAKATRVLEVFGYALKRYGVKNFVVDSLAKCGFGEDAYNEQKDFVDKLGDFARNNDVHVHLVCHARKGKDESEVPDKFDVKGTGALTDMVDNIFIVWRNKPKEEKLRNSKNDFERANLQKIPDAIVECCKQRNGEWEGKIKLWFEPASLQYLEAFGIGPKRYAV